MTFNPYPFPMKSPGNPLSLCCLLFMFLSNCGGRAQTSIVPPSKNISWNQALRQEKEWYSTGEAIRIADNLLLYQHNNGHLRGGEKRRLHHR